MVSRTVEVNELELRHLCFKKNLLLVSGRKSDQFGYCWWAYGEF